MSGRRPSAARRWWWTLRWRLGRAWFALFGSAFCGRGYCRMIKGRCLCGHRSTDDWAYRCPVWGGDDS